MPKPFTAHFIRSTGTYAGLPSPQLSYTRQELPFTGKNLPAASVRRCPAALRERSTSALATLGSLRSPRGYRLNPRECPRRGIVCRSNTRGCLPMGKVCWSNTRDCLPGRIVCLPDTRGRQPDTREWLPRSPGCLLNTNGRRLNACSWARRRSANEENPPNQLTMRCEAAPFPCENHP